MTDAPSPRCSSGMAEAELKSVRQQIVNFVDSGAQDGEPITVTNGDLCRWFDRLEIASAYLRDAADSGAGTFGVAQGQSDCGEEDIAIALFDARNHGLTNILPWDDIEHDGRDYWRAVARGLMRTHQVSQVSSTEGE